jgi:hypothetical protein
LLSEFPAPFLPQRLQIYKVVDLLSVGMLENTSMLAIKTPIKIAAKALRHE